MKIKATKNKRQPRVSSLRLTASPEFQKAILANEKRWAIRVADGIERGELPSGELERTKIADLVRDWGERLCLRAPSKGAGNPNFRAKLPGDDTVPHAVAFRIACGLSQAAAIADVAGEYDVEESTIRKLFKARLDALIDFFEDEEIAARLRAIRGK